MNNLILIVLMERGQLILLLFQLSFPELIRLRFEELNLLASLAVALKLVISLWWVLDVIIIVLRRVLRNALKTFVLKGLIRVQKIFIISLYWLGALTFFFDLSSKNFLNSINSVAIHKTQLAVVMYNLWVCLIGFTFL